MGITWRVVVVEDGDVGATQCLAIRGLPFRFLPGLGCAVEIAGRRQSDAPEVVHVLLALRDQDGVPVADRLRYLVDALERLCIPLFRPISSRHWRRVYAAENAVRAPSDSALSGSEIRRSRRSRRWPQSLPPCRCPHCPFPVRSSYNDCSASTHLSRRS